MALGNKKESKADDNSLLITYCNARHCNGYHKILYRERTDKEEVLSNH